MKKYFTKQNVLCLILCIAVLFLSVTSIYMYKELSSYKKMLNIMIEKVSDQKADNSNSEKSSNKSSNNDYKSNKSINVYSDADQDIYSDDDKCIIPSCNSEAENNSMYCFQHECMAVGCHNKRANDLCNYCIEHKCHAPNCNFRASFNSNYCTIHDD